MLSWEFPPRIVGGIAAHVYDLSLALSNLDTEVYVITCDFPGAKEYEEIDGVHVHRVDSYQFPTPDFASWTFMMNLNMLKQAIGVIKASRGAIDIVHAHDWLVADAAISLKHIFRIPMVATIHSTEYGRRNGIHTDYQRMIHQTEAWLSREAWRIICCSDYMKNHVSSALGFPRENIVIIPNGVDLNKFSEYYDREAFRNQFAGADEKLVLYVGRLVYEKGAHVLVNAISKVLQRVNAKFVIVGEGYLKDSLMKQTWELGLGRRVFFTGFLDDRLVKLLYRTADVCAVPSLYEPFGIVALEAMAAGTPVVTSGVGGLSEVIEHDKTGVIVYPNDPDSLAWGITRVLNDDGYSKRIRDNALEKIKTVYNWHGIAEKTRDSYQGVLEEYVKGSWKPNIPQIS